MRSGFVFKQPDMVAALLLAGMLGWGALVAAAELSDPTRPPGNLSAPGGQAPSPKPQQKLQLQATVQRPQGNVAVINGQVVAPGERIQGLQVLKVAPGRITIRRGQKVERLQVPAISVKRHHKKE